MPKKMHGLRAKVSAFSKELQSFTQQVSYGVEELKRTAKAKPWVGRESLGPPVDPDCKSSNLNLPLLPEVGSNALETQQLTGCLPMQLQLSRKDMKSLSSAPKTKGRRSQS